MIVDDKYFQRHFSGEFSQSVWGPSGVAPSGPWSHFHDFVSLRVLQLLRHEDRHQLEYTSGTPRRRVPFGQARHLFVDIETCRNLPALRG